MTVKPTRLNAVGQKHNNFEVTKSIPIAELQCWLRELVHKPTGARVMHLSNEDAENLFCLSFQTRPESSDGVAHILEHTVLCGSKKYPVKDPFFAMGRRSLNTFMNALTGSDFTCYPAASQVPKDFYNLLEVYLDAVFHANLNELSFLQEGHRLEFADPNDPSSQLERKGIVYNEMKGSLASANARLGEEMNAALFPNLTYGYNSGGDPKNIPQLTYQALCEFYQKYYHPSRCLFFFYGNMPLEGHLDFIEKHALQDVKKLKPLEPLPRQRRFDKPKRLVRTYPLSPDEDIADKTLISFGWLTCDILQQQDILALCILEIILMDTDASPLKQAFLKSGLCKQAGIYMDVDISEVPVVLTLRGCNPDSADDLEEIMRNTISDMADREIPLDMVENAMHQLEIFKSEIGGNHAPFGLHLFMRSGLLQQHGGKAEEALVIHSLFNDLRKRNLEDPTYLPGLLRTYFLDNPHFVRIVLMPDQQLAARELTEERAQLDKLQNDLNAAQKKQIVQKTAELAAFQKEQSEEDFDILPKIALEDVPKTSRNYALLEENVGTLTVFHHGCFTNGIVYADLVFPLPDLSEEELPIMRLLTVLLAQMGCGGRNYAETLEYIQAHTGGVSSYLTLNLQCQDHRIYYPTLYIRGKALSRKSPKLFPLMQDLISTVDFTDRDRLKEVLQKHYTTLHSTLNQSALRYAISLSASTLDAPSKIANDWYGLDYYWAIRKLVENIDQEIEPLIKKLIELSHRTLSVKNPHLVITCDKEMYDELKRHGFYGLHDIPGKEFIPWRGCFAPNEMTSSGYVISSPVAFTGHVFKTISYVNPQAPALSIASSLLDNLVLHPRIREQGGAYGSGAVSNALSGNFYFYAHRDPNIVNTLKAFDDSVKTIAAGNFEDSDVEEAKLEIVQSLDSPIAPGSRGDVAYGWLREGRTLEVRQTFRNRLLSATSDEVIAAVNAHLVSQSRTGAVVVFAGKELIEKENAHLKSDGHKPLAIKFI